MPAGESFLLQWKVLPMLAPSSIHHLTVVPPRLVGTDQGCSIWVVNLQFGMDPKDKDINVYK
jgi:hypothetical protein